MQHQKNILLYILFISISNICFSQTLFSEKAAHDKIYGAKLIRMNNVNGIPSFIQFQSDKTITREDAFKLIKKIGNLNHQVKFELISEQKDQLNHIHYKYKQYYNGIKVENGTLILHSDENDKIVSINNNVKSNLPSTSPLNSLEAARNSALKHVGAELYKWELEAEENHLKVEQDDTSASYFPTGELVFIQSNKKSEIKLAYKFNIYAHKPTYRAYVYIDANTKETILEDKLIKHIDAIGTATTAYSGSKTITTDNFNNTYRLRESGRGKGIETYDMNQGTSYSNAVDFTDTDNNWNNVNSDLDEYATDAHWGAEMTYDYFSFNHNRNSIDDKGYLLRSYVHFWNGQGNGFVNAFWDGQRMTYGDGNGSTFSPLTSVDIAGHEISHGLTSNTAELIYKGESGALNESFSDIFAVCIENYARPNNWNWTMGEDVGPALRSLSNPNINNHPNTYKGKYWINPDSTFDKGGVHVNSGIQNHWFYLLSDGGTGTNDNGDNYSVNGIGIDDASKIAFRNLTVYLTESSDFHEARFYAMISAIDLFGACSPEVEATVNAWYAVGVGNPYSNQVNANFSSLDTIQCSFPAKVDFTNFSSNSNTFTWHFGDGNSSTDLNPTHIYSNFGTFDVTLIADGGNCGKDTAILIKYIIIDTTIDCIYEMPQNGIGETQTGCVGKLYDSGGKSGNYAGLQTSTVTISPLGADSILLKIISFDVEGDNNNACNFDYLRIYDGNSVNATLIGKYCNNNLPPSTIISSGNDITLQFHSDQSGNKAGFEIDWSCFYNTTPPVVDFVSNGVQTCNGKTRFTDLSTNSPIFWLWNFGDGNTSIQENPVHQYSNSGTYTVSLKASNFGGSGNNTYTDLITVYNIDPLNTIITDTVCEGYIGAISAKGTGITKWYDSPSSGSLLYIGDTLTTPALVANTTFYAANFEPGATFNAGPLDNNFGSGGYRNNYHHLIFDVFEESILKSITVYSVKAKDRTVELRNDHGILIESKTIFIETGAHVINLDFALQIGKDYQIGFASGSTPNLYRNNFGVNYPYNSPNGEVSITNSSAGKSLYFYSYNWVLEKLGCESVREAIKVEVLPRFNVDLLIPNTVCESKKVIQLAASLAGGTWSANCANCIDPVSGVFTPTNAGQGNWTINYRVKKDCEMIFSDSILVEACLDVNDVEQNIKIYPNPVNNLLNIEFENIANQIIYISDVTGKRIECESYINNNRIQFNVNKIASGLYFVNIINIESQANSITRFVKE